MTTWVSVEYSFPLFWQHSPWNSMKMSSQIPLVLHAKFPSGKIPMQFSFGQSHHCLNYWQESSLSSQWEGAVFTCEPLKQVAFPCPRPISSRQKGGWGHRPKTGESGQCVNICLTVWTMRRCSFAACYFVARTVVRSCDLVLIRRLDSILVSVSSKLTSAWANVSDIVW